MIQCPWVGNSEALPEASSTSYIPPLPGHSFTSPTSYRVLLPLPLHTSSFHPYRSDWNSLYWIDLYLQTQKEVPKEEGGGSGGVSMVDEKKKARNQKRREKKKRHKAKAKNQLGVPDDGDDDEGEEVSGSWRGEGGRG